MKILLQPEAKTIGNRELIENQKYLINLVEKLSFGLNSTKQIAAVNKKITP